MTTKPKHTSTKAILLAFVLVLGMIVSPVCAADYTVIGPQGFIYANQKFEIYENVYNLTFDRSSDGEVISLIHFWAPQEYTVYFTLYYGLNNTVSGTASNVRNLTIIPLGTTTSTITFNGEEKSYTYLDTDPSGDFYLAGYAVNSLDLNQTGLIVHNVGYGYFDNDLAIFMPVDRITENLIYRVDISCAIPFTVDFYFGDAADVVGAIDKSILDIAWDWMNYAIGIASFVFGLVVALFYWLKFFFVDNLIMTVSIYISMSMAYSANTSKDIFKFFGKFFKDQIALFNFILSLWRALIEIISSFRGIFRI